MHDLRLVRATISRHSTNRHDPMLNDFFDNIKYKEEGKWLNSVHL